MKKQGVDEKKTEHLNNFEAQFKRSTIPLLVLQLLSEREMYAYEIIQEAQRRSDGAYKMPLLYTVLTKLKNQGYVAESRHEISEANRTRVYYRITEEGCHYLSELKKLYSVLTAAVEKIVY